jgi:hypothetical protein
MTGVIDPAPEEKPLVLLLAAPVSTHESLSFGIPPQPELFAITSSAGLDLPIYTSKLVEPEAVEAAAFVIFAAIPEPVIPRQTFATVAAAPADEGNTLTANEPATSLVYAAHSIDLVPAFPDAAPADTPAVQNDVAVKPLPKAVAPPPSAESAPTEVIATATVRPATVPERESGLMQTDEGHSYAREISASVKDTIPLSFEGRGWIYTGAGMSTSGITLNSRKITANETVFEFDVSAAGDYVLGFQFQDNFSGSMVSENVALRINEPKNGAQQPDILHPAPQESIWLAEAPGDLTAALDNPMAAVSSLPQILSSLGNGDEEGLDRIANWYSEAGYISEYRDCLEKYLEIFPGRRDNDRRYFELGKMYETVVFRNEKIARHYYAIIIDRYPASLYYGEAAARARYLDRHFLELR